MSLMVSFLSKLLYPLLSSLIMIIYSLPFKLLKWILLVKAHSLNVHFAYGIMLAFMSSLLDRLGSKIVEVINKKKKKIWTISIKKI